MDIGVSFLQVIVLFCLFGHEYEYVGFSHLEPFVVKLVDETGAQAQPPKPPQPLVTAAYNSAWRGLPGGPATFVRAADFCLSASVRPVSLHLFHGVLVGTW